MHANSYVYSFFILLLQCSLVCVAKNFKARTFNRNVASSKYRCRLIKFCRLAKRPGLLCLNFTYYTLEHCLKVTHYAKYYAQYYYLLLY